MVGHVGNRKIFDRKMKTLSGIKIQNDCVGCTARSENYFCSLPADALKDFESRKVTRGYPKGSTLFVEGQTASEVYILCAGRIKLSTYSAEGRSLIIRIAEPGEVLGLSACIAHVPHETTAQAITDCQVSWVRNDEFVDLIENDPRVALNAIRELSNLYHKAHTLICSLGLSGSASDKLAKLFLGWCGRANDERRGVVIPMSHTHEELAEMIGTSRETVTRLMKRFKDRNLVLREGASLIIPDPKRLKAVIGSRMRAANAAGPIAKSQVITS